MNLMLRWIFNIVTLLSLMLCVASVVFWIRGKNRADFIGYVGADRTLDAGSFDGYFVIEKDGPRTERGWHTESLEVEEDFNVVDWLLSDSEADHSFAGVHVFEMTSYGGVDSWTLVAPMWMVALATAIPPAIWLLASRSRTRRSRLKRGLCTACGYDLRGTPVSSACPECGAAQ